MPCNKGMIDRSPIHIFSVAAGAGFASLPLAACVHGKKKKSCVPGCVDFNGGNAFLLTLSTLFLFIGLDSVRGITRIFR